VGQSGLKCQPLPILSMATQSHPKPIFSGRYRHAMDKKHRITIPARWRSDGDEDEFFIVPDQSDSYLLVMRPEEFQKVEETVSKHEGLTPLERRAFIRRFYSNAQQCFSDKQGRLLLPEEHRKQVGLRDEGELVIAGSLSRFEIWNGKRWDDTFEAGTSAYRKVADLVGL
jgi:MraZ protein